jgi:hypothetical protein
VDRRKPNKTQPETQGEIIERLKPFRGKRILGGVLVNEREGFAFEVWDYRKLTDEEIKRSFDAWRNKRENRGKSLRGMRIEYHANHGLNRR